MNLSKLISTAKFNKRSDQEDSGSKKHDSKSSIHSSEGDFCELSKAPSPLGKDSEDTHPLEQACTEEQYIQSLVKTIKGNILPIIIEQHLEAELPEDDNFPPIEKINDETIEQLTKLVILEDARTSVNFVNEISTSGVGLEEIYLQLLTPVARNLGEMWESDELSFGDVTIALWRIKQLMYDLSPIFQQYAKNNKHGPSIMLVPLPGSQHNLGLFMVSEFFAKAGWRIWGELAATEEDILSMVEQEWFDIVGLSASVVEQFPQLKVLIAQIRLKSKNQQVGIIIGSPVFSRYPDQIQDLGADMVGLDAEDALEKATYYFERLGSN